MEECAKCGAVITSGGVSREDCTFLCDDCFEVRPQVSIEFEGEGGNSIAIIAACQRAAQKAGWSKATVEAWSKEAMSGDRDHLVDTVFEYFEVGQVRRYVDTVDRSTVR